jgi:hypothetical protein
MTAATIPTPVSKKISFSRALMAGGIAIVGSVIANLIVRWIGMLLLPGNPDFVPLATWQPTAVMTTLFLVVATIVFLIVNAFTANPPRVYNIVALIALIVSLIPNVMMLINPAGVALPDSGPPTAGDAIILMVQHVVAYAITVWAFTKWAQQG